jgi:AcrR family transcriptional regulator
MAMTDTTSNDPRHQITEAFMGLLAEKPFERIDLAEIAARAGLPLADLRGHFAGKLDMIAAHMKQIDQRVLAGPGEDMLEETPRERLFDVMMRRLEAMAPYKNAMRSLMHSATRNPPLGLALNGLAVRSEQWMLSAADISSAGPKGMMRAQGLALIFASVLRTWFHDDDPGLARTMAALDRALARGQRWSGLLDDLCRVPARFCPGGRRARRRRRRDEADDAPVAA